MSKSGRSIAGDEDGGMSASDDDQIQMQHHKEESIDEIADLPSQHEMRRELIVAIEEALREQEI